MRAILFIDYMLLVVILLNKADFIIAYFSLHQAWWIASYDTLNHSVLIMIALNEYEF